MLFFLILLFSLSNLTAEDSGPEKSEFKLVNLTTQNSPHYECQMKIFIMDKQFKGYKYRFTGRGFEYFSQSEQGNKDLSKVVDEALKVIEYIIVGTSTLETYEKIEDENGDLMVQINDEGKALYRYTFKKHEKEGHIFKQLKVLIGEDMWIDYNVDYTKMIGSYLPKRIDIKLNNSNMIPEMNLNFSSCMEY